MGDGQYPHAVGEAHFSEYVKTEIQRLRRLQNEGKCPHCEKFVPPGTVFKDAASEREYRLGGFCQTCQDELFVVDPEDENGFYLDHPDAAPF